MLQSEIYGLVVSQRHRHGTDVIKRKSSTGDKTLRLSNAVNTEKQKPAQHNSTDTYLNSCKHMLI